MLLSNAYTKTLLLFTDQLGAMEKTVFISSVIESLKNTRRKVESLLEGQGYNVVTSERRNSYFAGGDPENSCVRAVAKSDLYIGFFWLRHGFQSIGKSLSMTEIEYIAAKAYNLKRIVYIIKSESVSQSLFEGFYSKDRANKLQNFIDFELKVNQYCYFIDSVGQIVNREESGESKIVKDVKSAFDVPNAFSELSASTAALSIGLELNAKISLNKNPSEALRKYREVCSGKGRTRPREAVIIGAKVIDLYLGNQKLFESGEWLHFLEKWILNCSWIGYLFGPHSVEWAIEEYSNELFRMGYYEESIHEKARLTAFLCYVWAGILKSDFELRQAGRSKEIPGRDQVLSRARSCMEWLAKRKNLGGPPTYQAHISAADGCYSEALPIYDRMIREMNFRNECQIAAKLAYKARSYISKSIKEGGKEGKREGRSILADAISSLQKYEKEVGEDSNVLRVKKKIYQCNLLLGEVKSDDSIFKKLLQKAESEGLRHQALSIRATMSRGSEYLIN